LAHPPKSAKTSRFSRRDVLKVAAVGVGLLAGVSILGKLTGLGKLAGGPGKADPRSVPLPGEGSIFQPRRDARLEAWEREHPQ
jgi:hypothetical protein